MRVRNFLIKLLAGKRTVIINAVINQHGLVVRNNAFIHNNYFECRVWCSGKELTVNGEGRFELVAQ